jgi:hypothetical protein
VQIREAEKTIIARDKLIAELRLRMPATADRDEIILRATSKVTEAMQQRTPRDKEYKSEHSIKIAQSTIASLQVCDKEYKSEHSIKIAQSTIASLEVCDKEFKSECSKKNNSIYNN